MAGFTVYAIQFTISLTVYSLLVWWYVAPYLAMQPARQAMILLLLPQIAHHAGLAVLVPTIVGPGLPRHFAWIVSIADVTVLAIGLAAMGALRVGADIAYFLLWWLTAAGAIYNLYAGYIAIDVGPGIANQLGSHWYVAILYVPLLSVSHILVFWNLVRRGGELRTSALSLR